MWVVLLVILTWLNNATTWCNLLNFLCNKKEKFLRRDGESWQKNRCFNRYGLLLLSSWDKVATAISRTPPRRCSIQSMANGQVREALCSLWNLSRVNNSESNIKFINIFNRIIAVNYEARKFGVTRHMRGKEAKEICPDIILVTVPCLRGKADTSR